MTRTNTRTRKQNIPDGPSSKKSDKKNTFLAPEKTEQQRISEKPKRKIEEISFENDDLMDEEEEKFDEGSSKKSGVELRISSRIF